MLDEAIKNAPDDATKQQLQQEFEVAAVKLKGREARLADFANQTGLRRDRYREQVFAVKTEKTIAGYGKSVSGKAVYQAQRHYERFANVVGKANAPESLAKYYDLKYNDKEQFEKLKQLHRNIETGKLSRTEQANVLYSPKQFGKKIGKHAQDWGLDASDEEDRSKMLDIIDEICANATEIRIGEWRGQPGEVLFIIKDDDVVITTTENEFITILKGGISNERVKNARKYKV